MELTPEKRQQILRGEDGLGHQDATRAPLHMQERILSIRIARAEHRNDPAPSTSYIREAEKRSALAKRAIDFGRRVLAPITKKTPTRVFSDLEWAQITQKALRTQADFTAKEE